MGSRGHWGAGKFRGPRLCLLARWSSSTGLLPAQPGGRHFGSGPGEGEGSCNLGNERVKRLICIENIHVYTYSTLYVHVHVHVFAYTQAIHYMYWTVQGGVVNL